MASKTAAPGGLRTVFIAAVAYQRYQIARSREHRLDDSKIINVEPYAEHPGIVAEVLRHTEPSANDYAGHRRTIQYVTNADIGDTYPVFVGDLLQYRERGGFSDSQIELLTTFAEQAVIAISSAGTYRALQTRTADLQELLDTRPRPAAC